MTAHHILILGGTTEARRLAERLAVRDDIAATISLAGRTIDPAPQPLPTRSGGFGGIDGLVDYLAKERIDLIVDATHPFAARISANAAAAAASCGVGIIALRRPAWDAVDGDRWIRAADVGAAVAALGQAPRVVFLAIGRQEAGRFSESPQHSYLVRSVDPVEPPLAVPHCRYILATGPFEESDECRLLEEKGIDIVVAKNSGGSATYGKIAAARRLGIEVVMVERPVLPGIETVSSVDAAMARIDQRWSPAWKRGE